MTLTLVPAGAGAGKTHRIQTQLTGWVRDKVVRPDRILAVTFTEAAAAELSGRIRQSLLAAGMIEDAMAVERAYVSTIHSLGLRLMTEHAFASGATPQPRLLHEAEQDLLIRQELARCAALQPVAQDPDRYGHAATFSKGAEDGLRGRVLDMIALLRGLGEAGLADRLAPDACTRIRDLWGPAAADPAPLRDRLAQAVAALLDAHPGGALAPGQNATADKDFRRDLARLRAALEPGRLDRDWKLWNDLRGLRQTRRGAPTPPGYDALADAVMQAAAGVIGHPGPLQDVCTNLTALVTGAQAIMAGYAARKRDLGVIDYADMISGCEALLRQRPDVLASVLGEVDCVIIDEFQDTNPVQFALLWQLAARAPRCLLVGDAKQSIMGFQGADPRLSQALAEANPGSVDPLRQNWRSDPRLMAAINAIGAGLFGAAYTPLAPTREETGQPVLEVIALTASRRTRTPPKLPDHTAARIAAMLAAGELVTDRATGELRPVRPGDIAVLCQRHAEAARYADALRRLGLPVRISATGWHEAQAVLVARHAMALAVDPQDAHAALVVLTLGPAALPLDQALRLLADGALGDHPALHGVLAFAGAAPGWAVAELCLKVTARLRPWAEALPGAAQALADLARLEALAEEFDTSDPDMMAAAGFHGRGARVFLGWLASRLEERDFDRHPDPGAGAVPGIEIVTWHAAKGREWPVVVVCELDAGVSERENTTRAQFTDFTDLSRVLHSARLIHTPRLFTPEQRAVFLADRQPAAEAEARNLIYVALTRARDRLLIEWPEKALEKEATCLTLLSQAGARLGAGLTVAGAEFPSRIWRDPAGEGFDPVAAVPQPLHRFGAPAPAPIPARATPWRRRPSTLIAGPALPAPPQVIPLGPAQAAGRAQPATDRGTAWHRAFRVLASRPGLADNLPAATGLDASTLTAITAQVAALRAWLAREGYPDLHLEVPIHVTHPDGSETVGILDVVAMGPGRMLILDHKTGPAPDPEARFATYWPQLAAYAEALRLAFPGHRLQGVAIHWMNEGTLSYLPLEPATVR
jgi:ATP-dependent exoDNAse (exonuclease V) beta subunit